MNYNLITKEKQSSILEQILYNRGIPKEKMQNFLYPKESDMYDPLLLDNMKEAAELLIKNIEEGNKILVIVDVDCDGYTSSAILINYITRTWPNYPIENIEYFMHDTKIHGIEMDKIPKDMKLLIVPDASSNDEAQVRELHDLGIEVLILDHHHSDNPPEYACIVNNQLCDYPNKTLSGAGVVLKFLQYLDYCLDKDNSQYYYDLASLGIIADVMALNEPETRYILERGLNNVQNPFIKAMKQKQAYSLGSELTPTGVAFYIAPYVNAVVRSGTLDEKFIIFEAMLDKMGNKKIPSTKRGANFGETETLAERACRTASSVKNRQQKLRDKDVELLEEKIKQDNLLIHCKVLIFVLDSDEKTSKSLAGLVANIFAHKYQRPTLVLNRVEGTNTYAGSGRAPNYCGVDDFRAICENSGLCEFASGHNSAFGVGVKEQNIGPLREYFNEVMKDLTFEISYPVDFIIPYKNLTEDFVMNIADNEFLWGQNVEEPYILFQDIPIDKDNVSLLSADKNPTIKIHLPKGIDIMKFKSSKEEYVTLASDKKYIDIIGRCSKNEWNGNITPQILIEDYDFAEKEYYF